MITIPVAAPTNLFKWQTSLFQFAQQWVYGDVKSFYESLILIVDRNDHKFVVKEIDWNLRIPYKIVRGIHSILDESENHPHFAAGNLFFALKSVIDRFYDNEVICILDADIIPLRRYDGVLPEENAVITCNFYEDWHIRCSRPDKENYRIVEPFLKHDIHQFMDGGFVPILIRVKTLKKILDEVLDLSLEIVRKHLGTPFGWWMQMWAFQIACHNNQIKCLGQDNTYFPHQNELDLSKHFFAHYSCDTKFKKGTFPNHNIEEFPDNVFYNLLREWYHR